MPNFDINSFQDKVLSSIDLILSSEGFEQNSINLDPSETTLRAASSNGFEEMKKEAETLSQRSDVRAIICPALKSIANDANEVAKTIVPVLIPLILAGTIVLPINPILFGWLALIITRSGIASLCADYQGQS